MRTIGKPVKDYSDNIRVLETVTRGALPPWRSFLYQRLVEVIVTDEQRGGETTVCPGYLGNPGWPEGR